MRVIDKKVDIGRVMTYDIEVPDVHNYVLANGCVVHNSSQSAGTTNGIYPIRKLNLIKTNDTQVNHWVAPDATKLKNKYQSAWDIKTSDMIKYYSIIQKFTDQGISADLYINVQGNNKVSSTDMVQDYLDMVKLGLKSRYYVVSNTSKGVDLTTTESAFEAVETVEELGECESCAL